MSTISLFVDVLGPVLLLVTLGTVVGSRLGIESSALSPLAYWVLGPAFVFDLFEASGLDSGTVTRLALAGLAGMAAAAAVAGLGVGLLGHGASVRSASVLTGAYGNVGNAGLAITVFALGDDALAAAGVLMLTINVAGITLGVVLAARRHAGPLTALRRGLVAPMTMAAGAAIVVNLTSAPVPLAVDRSIELLAGALIPVMLLTLGIQLAATGLRWPTDDIAVAGVAKLIAAPVGAVGAATVFGVEGELLGAVAIQSAMPPAVFTMLLAMENDVEPERVTNAVVTLTVASLATLPVVLTIFG